MRLLLDTDLFCKLGVADLLEEAFVSLGVLASDCARLPALLHMLRRGSLPKIYGVDACKALIPVAEGLGIIGSPDADWVDRLASVQYIDPGEAHLFAIAAQQSLSVLSGDKRALRALKDVAGYADALSGRIVVLESVLILLCERMGHSEVRCRLQPLIGKDTMLSICFSEGNADPVYALTSYYKDLEAEIHPLVLWKPKQGGLL